MNNCFRFLPLLGCARDRSGRITDVTDRLLEAEGLRRRDVIGRPLIAVWPHGSQWLELDRRALQQRKPLVQIEPSAHARWFRSTRVPTGRRVLWYGEDVTAEVRLATMRALASVKPRPLSVVADGAEFAQLLIDGSTVDELASKLAISFDQAAGACMRLLSQS